MQDNDRILSLLIAAKQAGASDLLLVAGAAPSIYVNTRMETLGDQPLSAVDLQDMVTEFLSAKQRERLNHRRDLDFSIGHRQVGRCRINIHYQRRSLAVAVRFISSDIPELDQLHLPPRLAELANLPRGLVLITGPTGSGKSTTLAALIQRINRRRRAHVITMEDPIEFAFRNEQSIIEQREIGDDSPSFSEALRHVVRQRPDVILVGEMRDLETIAAALTAAETGHLVLASLHTNTAAHTVQRVVDVFDSQAQQQVRVQLAAALKAIACQVLFPNERDGGMIPAVELMIVTPAIARAVRDNNTHLIDSMIETGGQQGMQTLDAAIAKLVREGLISRGSALTKAADPERLERLLGRHTTKLEPVGTGVSSAQPRPWE
ncbi:MAG: PilT/PilU family type 4a pilus ATPase [Phycisphaerae bacterium]|nr:PilT/PilU family type 4a pilus ATPase [Phycisphaerae bacterium]